RQAFGEFEGGGGGAADVVVHRTAVHDGHRRIVRGNAAGQCRERLRFHGPRVDPAGGLRRRVGRWNFGGTLPPWIGHTAAARAGRARGIGIGTRRRRSYFGRRRRARRRLIPGVDHAIATVAGLARGTGGSFPVDLYRGQVTALVLLCFHGHFVTELETGF